MWWYLYMLGQRYEVWHQCIRAQRHESFNTAASKGESHTQLVGRKRSKHHRSKGPPQSLNHTRHDVLMFMPSLGNSMVLARAPMAKRSGNERKKGETIPQVLMTGSIYIHSPASEATQLHFKQQTDETSACSAGGIDLQQTCLGSLNLWRHGHLGALVADKREPTGPTKVYVYILCFSKNHSYQLRARICTNIGGQTVKTVQNTLVLQCTTVTNSQSKKLDSEKWSGKPWTYRACAPTTELRARTSTLQLKYLRTPSFCKYLWMKQKPHKPVLFVCKVRRFERTMYKGTP